MDQIPAWEPDVKAHIPPNVTLDSRQAAYAQQGNPPPLLRTAIDARQDAKRDRVGMLRRPAVNGIVVLQEGPKGGGSLRGSKDRKGKGKVEIGLGTENRGGIAGEYVLDPSLPFALPDDAVDLSRSRSDLQGGTKRKRGSIDGERPSAIFRTEGGDVDLRLSVVNEETMRGEDMLSGADVPAKRAKKARMEVTSVRGHVRVDLVSAGICWVVHRKTRLLTYMPTFTSLSCYAGKNRQGQVGFHRDFESGREPVHPNVGQPGRRL